MSPRPSKSSRRRRCSEGVPRLAASLAECDAGKPSNFGTKTMPQCCIPAAVLLPLPPRTHVLVRLWYTLTPRGAAWRRVRRKQRANGSRRHHLARDRQGVARAAPRRHDDAATSSPDDDDGPRHAAVRHGAMPWGRATAEKVPEPSH